MESREELRKKLRAKIRGKRCSPGAHKVTSDPLTHVLSTGIDVPANMLSSLNEAKTDCRKSMQAIKDSLSCEIEASLKKPEQSVCPTDDDEGLPPEEEDQLRP